MLRALPRFLDAPHIDRGRTATVFRNSEADSITYSRIEIEFIAVEKPVAAVIADEEAEKPVFHPFPDCADLLFH
jgi:hypothetical protein